MDLKVDPCDDFYEFSCGNFMGDHSIPLYQKYVNTFVNIEDRINRQVLCLLSEPIDSTEPRSSSMAKSMFNTCINVKHVDGRGSAPLIDILFRLGGWPILKGDDWVDSNWTITKYLKQIRDEGFDMEYLFTMGVDRDPKNGNNSIIGVSSLFIYNILTLKCFRQLHQILQLVWIIL